MTAEVVLWASGVLPDCATALARGSAIIVVADSNQASARKLIASPIFPGHELERAARFHFDRNRVEFLLARGITRTVLAAELAVAPHDVPFGGHDNQKPRVSCHAGRQIDVSISHSAGWVACGFAADRDIGVDVEEDDGRSRDTEGLAARILTAGERLLFASVGVPQRKAWFLDAWRRKEAILKAAGLGLAGNPASIEVFHRDPDGRTVALETVAAAGRCWHVRVEVPRGGPTVALALAAGAGLPP